MIVNSNEVENDSDDEDESCELTLIFTSEGKAILEEEGEAVWFSDDDDDFSEVIGNEFLEAEYDTAKVLDYLVEEGSIEEDEKEKVEIEQEDLDESDDQD